MTIQELQPVTEDFQRAAFHMLKEIQIKEAPFHQHSPCQIELTTIPSRILYFQVYSLNSSS
jgi:hypothetical protein